MAIVVERVPDVTSGTGAVIEIVEGDHRVYRAASGAAKEHLGLRLPFATSLSGLAVRSKTLVVSDDTDLDPRVDAAACQAIGIRSMVIAPLLEAGVAVGALKTFSPRPKTFNDLDSYALQLRAGMASGALTQARTFREREASEARYRLLFDRNVAGVFRSTLDAASSTATTPSPTTSGTAPATRSCPFPRGTCTTTGPPAKSCSSSCASTGRC